MHEVLDEIEAEKPVPGKVFSILSFAFAMLTLVLGMILMAQIMSYSRNERFLRYPPMILIRGVEIACIAGVIFAVASMVKKEKLPYLKAIGAFLNFLIFGLILGLVVFAAILDMNRHE
jgi:cytochrome bd-type quinol oxidase subunit 2